MLGNENLKILVEMLESDWMPEGVDNFNLHAWWHKNTHCGTCACAVGFGCLYPPLQAKGLSLEIMKNSLYPGDFGRGEPRINGSLSFTKISEFFGLTIRESQHVFCLSSYEKSIPSREDVAKRIRRMMKKGGI